MSTAPAARPGRIARPARRRLPGVLVAFVFLTIATMGITGDPFWLLNQGTPWVAAGVLALLGLGLIGSTLPGLRKR